MIRQPAWPHAKTPIPDLLRHAPQAREVLDRYGLRGCGGPLGPAESLAYFARAHEVPLPKLLAELHQALGHSAAAAMPEGQPALADTIYRPFFKAGIATVLTLGAVWGAYLLLRIAFSGEFAAAGVQEVNAHGHAQIFGWVGLFVMGFAYQAFPRFKHTSLVWPRLALATLVMMLAGIVVRSIAQPLAGAWDGAWWLAVGAAALEVVAVGLFAAIILTTWRRSGKGLVFYEWYIVSALGWFVGQAIYEAVYLSVMLSAEGAELVRLVAAWQPALRDMQIHGFALLMVLGVSQRIFHHFYGLPQPSVSLSRRVLLVLNLAVMGEVVGLVLMRTSGHGWATLWYGSALALAGGTVTLVWNWRIFSPTEEADRNLKFLRAAYIWLFISLAMLVLLPVYQWGLLPALVPESQAVATGFSHAYYGAIRHAITVGFVSLMIVGVSGKVVPTLNGLRSQVLTPLWAPFILINLGCTLRVVGQTATDLTTFAFPVAGASGLLEVTGLALWGTHLWLVMSGRPRIRRPATDPPQRITGPIAGHHTVAAVLNSYPELLEVFLEHGFSTLANPAMRAGVARIVTLEKACHRTGTDLDSLLTTLNQRRQPLPPTEPQQLVTIELPPR